MLGKSFLSVGKGFVFWDKYSPLDEFKMKTNFVLILGAFEIESLNHLTLNYFLGKLIMYLTDCGYPSL